MRPATMLQLFNNILEFPQDATEPDYSLSFPTQFSIWPVKVKNLPGIEDGASFYEAQIDFNAGTLSLFNSGDVQPLHIFQLTIVALK